MRLFDTHCHFESADRETVGASLRRARTAGVTDLMAVGGSPELNAGAVCAAQAAREFPDEMPAVCLALGYDRDQIGKGGLPSVTAPAELADAWRAWGEIGLDYHYSPETRAAQTRHFADQLEQARRRDLPVSIHTREADDDTLGILREIPSRGIIHCFTGTVPFARQLLDLGYFISISGIVTFRAADNVRAVARYVPDNRLLIETDAPYLAPVPMRGRPNEPAFIAHTCAFLARERGRTPESLADLTAANARAVLATGAGGADVQTSG